MAPAERSTAAGYGQFVLAAIGLVVMTVGPVCRAFRSGPEPPSENTTRSTAGHQVVNSLLGDVTGTAIQVGTIHGGVTICSAQHDPDGTQATPIMATAKVTSRVKLYDGALLGNTVIEILVEGRGSQAVILHSIRPIVLRRRRS